jgi:hypothetical protein
LTGGGVRILSKWNYSRKVELVPYLRILPD